MKLPEPVHKPPFSPSRAPATWSSVCLTSRASRAFYVDLLGMAVSDEDATTLWLRGLEEGCHHSLVLKIGEPACERVGLRVLTEEDLHVAKAHFEASGFPTAWAGRAAPGAHVSHERPCGHAP